METKAFELKICCGDRLVGGMMVKKGGFVVGRWVGVE